MENRTYIITDEEEVLSISMGDQSNVKRESETYRHATLLVDENGVSFSDLPYKPSPYPASSMKVKSFINHAEGKRWHISADAQANHIWYQNDQTNNRLVYQCCEATKSAAERITKKEAEGYQLYNSSADWTGKKMEDVPF